MDKSRAVVISLVGFGFIAICAGSARATEPLDGAKRLACFGNLCVERTAVKYLGDACWIAQNSDGDVPIRLGITHMGAARFAFNGVIGADEAFPITGNAVRIAGKWAFTLIANGGEQGIPVSATLTVDAAGATLFSGTLDPTTLDGTIFATNAIGVSQETPSLPSALTYLGAFPLKKTSCK